MKRTIRYILYSVSAGVLAACILLAVMAGRSSRESILCKGLNVVILDSHENNFVSEADIKTMLKKEYGQYIGVPMDSINLNRIEDIVDGRSAVLKSEAFVTRDSMLNIRVTQRKPIVRFQRKDGGFYADSEGFVFPLQSSYSSHVHIVDGDIPIDMKSGHKGKIEDREQKEWFDKVMNVINYMDGNRTWKDRIVQIHVSNGGELTLIPREGKERFIFGQPVNIADKFRRMEKYYTAIAPAKPEGHYSTINIEYNGQIVCR